MRKILHRGVSKTVARALGLVVCGLCLVGCPEQGPTLDEAIAEYLDASYQSSRTRCSCYHLYVHIATTTPFPYESEEHCLAVIDESKPTDEHVECVKSILAQVPQDDKENIELMQCYAAAARDYVDCYSREVAATCDSKADDTCSHDFDLAHDACEGYRLSADHADSIFYCSTSP